MGRTVEVSQFLSLLSNWEQLFAEKKKKKKKKDFLIMRLLKDEIRQ